MPTAKKLFVFQHLELGDALICNGLVRTLAESYPDLAVMTKCCYVPDVRRMYADLPRIQVLGALSYPEVSNRWLPKIPNAIKLGFFGRGFDLKNWDVSFYKQANIPFENRWSKFKLGFPIPPPSHGNFILCHEDVARGYRIDPSKLPVTPQRFDVVPRASFWDWLPDVLAAKELHVIDSCVLNLADLLWHAGYLKNTELVFHRYAKKYVDTPAKWPTALCAPWEVL